MLFGKYLKKYYKKYWYLFLIGIAALIIVDYIQLFIAKYIGNLVDLFDESTNFIPEVSVVVDLTVKVLIVATTMIIGRVIWRLTIFKASINIETGLRHDMFEKAEKLSPTYYHSTKVGNILSWFTTDIQTIEEYFGWGTITLIDAIFLSLFTLWTMFDLEPILSLIAFLPLILIIVWGALCEKYMSLKWETRQKETDKIYDFAQETFTGIRVIKAFVKENQQLRAFSKVARNNEKVNVDFTRIRVIFDISITLIINLIFVLILGFGSYFVIKTVTKDYITIADHIIELSAGNLVTFITLFDTLIWPMMALGQIFTMKSRAKTSYKRIERFLDSYVDIHDNENSIQKEDFLGDIEFRDFHFKYADDDHEYLKGISLKINHGESIGIIGKIGSGKTTLANSLMRLYNLNKGQVFIDGIDIMDIKFKCIRDAISYVPQDNFIFSDTIENNICFSLDKVNEEAMIEATKSASVYEDISSFKDGFKTVTGERGVSLSGGQKQRISIARAFLKNAPILILDDSVSAVDTNTEESILKCIRKERKGKTTIVVASRISTIAKLDKIIVLDEGRLEAFDTHENLLNTSKTYSKLAYLQELEKEVEKGGKNG